MLSQQSTYRTGSGDSLEDKLRNTKVDDWNAFDQIALQHISETVESLKTQLDNMLLFAALFSAVNSSFLVYSLPDLTPNSVDQTNALLLLLVQGVDNQSSAAAQQIIGSQSSPSQNWTVVTNQLFSISLMCSLIASLGAVVGHLWLNSFSKPARGSSEDVRKSLQLKIIGAQNWGFRPILEVVLPSILQLSLLIFIAGFILLLASVNTAVAYSVIPFAVVGLGALISSGVIAVWDPSSPFQSPFTTTIFPVCIAGVRRGRRWLARAIKTTLTWAMLQPAFLLRSALACTRHRSKVQPTRRPQKTYSWDDVFDESLPSHSPSMSESFQRTRFTRKSPPECDTHRRTLIWVTRNARTYSHILHTFRTILQVGEPHYLSNLAKDQKLMRYIEVRTMYPVDPTPPEWVYEYSAIHAHIFLGLKDPSTEWCQRILQRHIRNNDVANMPINTLLPYLASQVKLLKLPQPNPDMASESITLMHQLHQRIFSTFRRAETPGLVSFCAWTIAELMKIKSIYDTEETAFVTLWNNYDDARQDGVPANFGNNVHRALAAYARCSSSGHPPVVPSDIFVDFLIRLRNLSQSASPLVTATISESSIPLLQVKPLTQNMERVLEETSKAVCTIVDGSLGASWSISTFYGLGLLGNSLLRLWNEVDKEAKEERFLGRLVLLFQRCNTYLHEADASVNYFVPSDSGKVFAFLCHRVLLDVPEDGEDATRKDARNEALTLIANLLPCFVHIPSWFSTKFWVDSITLLLQDPDRYHHLSLHQIRAVERYIDYLTHEEIDRPDVHLLLDLYNKHAKSSSVT